MALRDQILQQALELPAVDQAFLVQSLEDHLIAGAMPETAEGDGVDSDELLKELERRSEGYRAGNIPARPLADVMADFRRRQASEKSR